MIKSMHLDPSILREYDIRGIVNKTLNIDNATAIGKAFGSIVCNSGLKTIAVGWDGRLSSPQFKSALINGLLSTGVTVFSVGLGPSPMLYYSAHTLPADAAVMVTGSHNPPEYNGFKFMFKNEPFFGKQIQELGHIINSAIFVEGDGNIVEFNILEDYVKRLFRDYRGKHGLRVAWDPSNGSTGEAVRLLVEKLPGDHFIINEKIDGNFPSHHPDPTVEDNLSQLRELVLTNKCDVGLSFDGDGDRIGVIDSIGRIVWGDQLLVMLAREVLEEKPGSPIICDVKASRVFFDTIRELGGEPVMWKVGHSNIKSKMKELNAPLAGEMSAHIFFKHRYYGFDDALYTSVRLLSLLETEKESLTEKFDKLPKLSSTPEIRFFCAEKHKFKIVDEIRNRLKSDSKTDVCDLDGIRVESNKGWWLLRASNTQPALVARCEANNEIELLKLKTELEGQLSKSGVILPN